MARSHRTGGRLSRGLDGRGIAGFAEDFGYPVRHVPVRPVPRADVQGTEDRLPLRACTAYRAVFEECAMPGETSGSPHVVIIGAGVVGACCAACLQEQGARVTLIDRQQPGDDGASSFGNAGVLAPASLVPTPAPGMLAKIPGWLLKEDGPLSIRWSYLPRLLPWLLRFVRAGGDAAHQRKAADALAALHASTLDLHTRFAREAGVPELVAPAGYLHVYGSGKAYAEAGRGLDLCRERGVEFEVLGRGELHEAEPDLAPHYVKGVLVRGQGRTLNPGRLIRAYVDRVVANGGALRLAEVTGVEAIAGRIGAVRTGDGTIEGDAFVLSAGAFSRRLAARIFAEGKSPDFHLDAALGQLVRMVGRRRNLLRSFLEIQFKAAWADGFVHPAERAILEHIGVFLGFSARELEQMERLAAADFAPRRASEEEQLAAAYGVLGLDPSVGDETLRASYKRLMLQHHPDRLAAQGLPAEMKDEATRRTQEIQRAYQTIRDARKEAA